MINALNNMLSGNMNEYLNKGFEEGQDITHQYQKFQSSRFHFESRQNQEITLLTDEGDKITINKSNESMIDYMSFDYTRELKNKIMTEHDEKGKIIQADSFNISIEGDLNEEEMAEVQNILKSLDQIMKDLKKGNLENVLKRSSKLLEDKETLSSLNAVLQFSQEIEIEERQVIRRQNMPHPPEKLKPVNILDFVKRVTDKVKNYMEKTEKPSYDISEIMKQLFPEIQQPLIDSQ